MRVQDSFVSLSNHPHHLLYILLALVSTVRRSAMYLAKVYIQPRPTVSDPQGQTIRGGLLQLGFDSVTSVRAGKYMEITLQADTEAHASDQVRQMCDKLLANPVIEDYRFDLDLLNQ